MKILFYILFLLTFLSCKNQDEQKRKNWKMEDLTDEEIDFIKGVYKQKQEGAAYKSKLKRLLGLVDIRNLEIAEGHRVYHFERRAEYDQDLEIVEILDTSQLAKASFKKVKYKMNRTCNPEIGNKKLTKECIELLQTEKGEISPNAMDSLNQFILDNGFWEFTEQESDIRRYTDLLYHGESWSLEGRYTINYSHINGIDTTISKSHYVHRLIPDDFKAFKEIGMRIYEITQTNSSR